MIKFKLILISLFICLRFYGQINKVTYKTIKFEIDKEKFAKFDANIRELAEKFLNSQSDAVYTLLYTKNESLFKTVQALDTNEETQNFKSNSVNIYYKNINNKEKIYCNDQFGQNLNVIKKFDEYNWIITNETKEINGYKCFKATTVFEDTFNPIKNRKVILYPYVWFTPDIPASFGPRGFDGLPGLILEAYESKMQHFFASKIEFDILNSEKVEKPVALKTISNDEFNAMITSNLQKIKDETGQ